MERVAPRGQRARQHEYGRTPREADGNGQDTPFVRPARHAGTVKYTFGRSLSLALNGIISLSKAPLRLATYFGFMVSLASFLLALVYIVQRIRGQEAFVRGWASTVVIMLFLGGVQLLTIGIIGEYLSRIYDEVKQRPLYVVRRPADRNERSDEV